MPARNGFPRSIIALCFAVIAVPALAEVRPEDRPQISGRHPYEVELLEDALLRKQPRALNGDRDKARRKIGVEFSRRRGSLQGQLAEAIFIERHRGWGYVRSPIATQHDAYLRIPGRMAPYTAQVKFHERGRPYDYARDMKADWRSARFVVPDDHVEPLRSYLQQRENSARARGDVEQALGYSRDYSRVARLGATSTEVIEKTSSAAQYSRLERNARFIALGSIVGNTLALGGKPESEATWALANSFAQAGVYEGVDNFLKKKRPSPMTRGSGAQAVLASAITVTNAAFLVGQYGWRGVLRDSRFQDQVAESAIGWTSGQIVGRQLARRAAGSLVSGPLLVMISAATAAQLGSMGYREARHQWRLHKNPDADDASFLKDADHFKADCASLEKKLRDLTSKETGFRCKR